MKQPKLFKYCYILEVSGKTQSILDISVDDFILGTVVPLLTELAVGNEMIVIRVGKTKCTDANEQPHTCLAKIHLRRLDKRKKKR